VEEQQWQKQRQQRGSVSIISMRALVGEKDEERCDSHVLMSMLVLLDMETGNRGGGRNR